MEQLLPDRLKELWRAVDENQLSVEAFTSEQERLLDDYRRTWIDALILEGHDTLRASLLSELGTYMSCAGPAEIEARCARAVALLKGEWQAKVIPSSRHSIEQFYDESQNTIYELMWWHSLTEDASPLSYVTALHFARRHGGRRYLDFGAGVGSGSILFARHGFDERIFFDDGKIEGVIRSVRKEGREPRLEVKITNATNGTAKLRAEKGINLPDTKLSISALTPKDREDLEFAIEVWRFGFSLLRSSS